MKATSGKGELAVMLDVRFAFSLGHLKAVL
jgi:hypothetical protein